MKELVFKKGSNSFKARLLTKNTSELKELTDRLKLTNEQSDDLVEEQRPNLLNRAGYSIITLVYPTLKTLKTGGYLLQTTYIITPKEVNLIINKENRIVEEAFNKLKKIKFTGVTSLLSHLIDWIRESSIKTFDAFEDYLQRKEREIIQNKRDKKLLIKMHDLKETLYMSMKTINNNAEVIKEVLMNKARNVKPRYFSEHHEDRELYFADLISYSRETVNTNIETYLSLMSHKINEQIYKLTILGSILIIPTVLSGLFGMNVQLPPIGFWGIIGLSTLISLITYGVLR